MAVVAYYNGQFVDPESAHIQIDERGHQYGDGVYEVIRVYGGRLFLTDWHIERLINSLNAVEIQNPHTYDEWLHLLAEAVRRSGEAEANVYLQVTRGTAPRNHLFPNVSPSVSMTVRPFTPKAHSWDTSVVCLPDERWANAYVKTLNLLPNIIAKEIAHRAGAVEALLVRAGDITEGSSSNAWFVRGDVLYTAPANRYILGGITRRYVKTLAEELGYTVKEEAIRFADLKNMDEVFMTGTTTEVLPITKVLYHPQNVDSLTQLSSDAPHTLLHSDPWFTYWEATQPGQVTDSLQKEFADRIEKFKNYQEA